MYRRNSDTRIGIFTLPLMFVILAVTAPNVVHAQTPRQLAVDTKSKSGPAESVFAAPDAPASTTDASTPAALDRKPSDSEIADRLGALEEALRSQNSRIEEMQR